MAVQYCSLQGRQSYLLGYHDDYDDGGIFGQAFVADFGRLLGESSRISPLQFSTAEYTSGSPSSCKVGRRKGSSLLGSLSVPSKTYFG